ncbi:hypothetical protein AFLA_011764 [Aspergillus flavus NRRL3357]|nr:hypothetical protein AFLA_011764 [Aspergillus flavus NRRL3357]
MLHVPKLSASVAADNRAHHQLRTNHFTYMRAPLPSGGLTCGVFFRASQQNSLTHFYINIAPQYLHSSVFHLVGKRTADQEAPAS